VVSAFFNRLQPGIQLTYKDVEQGRELAMQLQTEQVILDIAAVIDSHNNLKAAVMNSAGTGHLHTLPPVN
jgi:hypothetical protein